MARGSDEAVGREGYLSPLSRHTADVVRLVIALGALALTMVPIEPSSVPVLEEDAFRFFNDLPSVLFPVIWLPMQLGSVGAVPAATVIAALARRRLLAVELAVAGTLAWGLAKIVKVFFDRPRPGVMFDDATLHGDVVTGLGYLSGHAAIAATLATVAGPWLPRRLRRLAWALALLVGASRIYVGAHLPLDVLGGYALGWAIGACVHLLLGAPGGRPTPDVTARGLRAMGIEPVSLERVSPTAFVATTETDRYHVRVLGRDQRDADVVHRSWRRMVSRWFREKPPFASPRHRVDHEAATALLARAAGARVPAVVAVRTFGAGVGILVTEWVEGDLLRDVGNVDDALLADLWRQVALLHAGRVSHGDLHAGNVLVDEARCAWLVDFTLGESGADRQRLHQDVAELLAALLPLVGAPAAVAAARAALGQDELDRVGDLLRQAGVAGESAAVRHARPALLDALAEPAASRG